MAFAAAPAGGDQVVGGRPAGCPRSFCGCGVALRVFGHIVPELNLASNWLRFPRTSPAPGMVAARRGHVFVLEQHVSGDVWMAYDPNSGGHATRVHARSLRGYAVVNPHAQKRNQERFGWRVIVAGHTLPAKDRPPRQLMRSHVRLRPGLAEKDIVK